MLLALPEAGEEEAGGEIVLEPWRKGQAGQAVAPLPHRGEHGVVSVAFLVADVALLEGEGQQGRTPAGAPRRRASRRSRRPLGRASGWHPD